MPSLTLPRRTPSSLRAFWLVASAGVGLTAAAVASAVRRDPRLLALALPVAAVTAAPGLRDPWRVDVPYRAWNRLGREVGTLVNDYLGRVAFEATRASRRLGSNTAIPQHSPGRSGWIERHTQAPGTFPFPDARRDGPRDADAFGRYAAQSGNEWAESVRPLVRLLNTIETADDADEAPPTDVYTLY